jgi:hypothetical protein
MGGFGMNWIIILSNSWKRISQHVANFSSLIINSRFEDTHTQTFELIEAKHTNYELTEHHANKKLVINCILPEDSPFCELIRFAGNFVAGDCEQGSSSLQALNRNNCIEYFPKILDFHAKH